MALYKYPLAPEEFDRLGKVLMKHDFATFPSRCDRYVFLRQSVFILFAVIVTLLAFSVTVAASGHLPEKMTSFCFFEKLFVL